MHRYCHSVSLSSNHNPFQSLIVLSSVLSYQHPCYPVIITIVILPFYMHQYCHPVSLSSNHNPFQSLTVLSSVLSYQHSCYPVIITIVILPFYMHQYCHPVSLSSNHNPFQSLTVLSSVLSYQHSCYPVIITIVILPFYMNQYCHPVSLSSNHNPFSVIICSLFIHIGILSSCQHQFPQFLSFTSKSFPPEFICTNHQISFRNFFNCAGPLYFFILVFSCVILG